MLNIISLSVLRDKVTWPGKVVKNLIKGLDILWYPYVINKSFDTTSRLWIHDDVRAINRLGDIPENTKVIIGPNLYNLHAIPKEPNFLDIPYIMPCSWIIDFWKTFGYSGKLISWPTWIDTDLFAPSEWEKTSVLVYIKKRFPEEKAFIFQLLATKSIPYSCIEYGSYRESDFKVALQKAKYVIWVGCPETQWVALWEILSSNIPILLWDARVLWHWFPSNESDASLFTPEEKQFSPVTSAPYFDESCGKRVFSEIEIPEAIDFMELSWKNFTPRKYILENLSLAKQARDFIDLYDTHYGLTFIDGMKEWWRTTMMKSYHYSWLWKCVFSIYDSKPFQKLFHLIFR